MYCCKSCGILIREDDVTIEKEPMGEAWGRTQYVKWLLCPKCGENVDEFYGEEDEEDGLELFQPMF